MHSDINLNTIGYIKAEKGRFYVSIKEDYKEALKGLEGFSHINLIWWGNHSETSEKRAILTVKKPYKKGPDVLGIFSTRSEIRPNPVLVSISAVMNIDHSKGIIKLPWIDAENGSPVLDIKPYLPCSDRVKDVSVPDWCAGWPKWSEDSATFDWEAVFNF